MRWIKMICKNCGHEIIKADKVELYGHANRETLQWNSRCTVGKQFGEKYQCHCVNPEQKKGRMK